MSVSANPVVVIGINSRALYKVETKNSEFEVHDKKGNPTGTFEKEYVTTLSTTVNGNKKSIEVNGRGWHRDDIETLLEIDDVGGYNDKFGLHNLTYEHDEVRDIIGIQIASVNAMYTTEDFQEVNCDKVIETIAVVKKEISNRFGVDVKPSLFLYGNCSY
jgi:hypothetical protein